MPRADQAPHDLPKTIRFLRTPESRSRGLSEERSRAFQRHIDVNIHLRADVNREVTSLKTVDSSHDVSTRSVLSIAAIFYEKLGAQRIHRCFLYEIERRQDLTTRRKCLKIPQLRSGGRKSRTQNCSDQDRRDRSLVTYALQIVCASY